MTDSLPPVEVPFVDLRVRSAKYRSEWMKRIRAVIDSGRFIGGEEVTRFEREFASYLGCRYGVGTGSGADALKICLMAEGVGPGDEVITVSHTFSATVDAISHLGATPVFVDVDSEYYTMDPEQLHRAMGPRVKAVIPVHLYGQSADMGMIREICDQAQVSVIEDAAQAHGAKFDGRKVGGLGRAGCFSFYPSKNMGALGDGGFIATNDEALASRVAVIRDCGQDKKYHQIVIGLNSRLDALQAAVLRTELKHLDAWNARRRAAAKRYYELLNDLEPSVKLPMFEPGGITSIMCILS